MSEFSFETEYAVEFLQTFDPNGWHNLVAIDPEAGSPIGRTFPPDAFHDISKFVERYNGKRNLYFTVNEPSPTAPHKKLEKGDIGAIRAVFTDIDPTDANLTEERQRLKALAFDSDADIVIDSGGGVQLFWQLASKIPAADFEWAEGCCRRLGKDFGGDNTWNVDRLMRLPYTVNLPDAKKRAKGRSMAIATVLRSQPGRWTRDALEQAFPPISGDRAGKDHSSETRETSTRILASDYASFAEYHELPIELRHRLAAALSKDPSLGQLWHGEGAGNEFRFELAAKLKAFDFEVEDYARLANVWQRSTSKPERPSARELARDWVRSPAIISAADEFGVVELDEPVSVQKRQGFYTLGLQEVIERAQADDSVPLIEHVLDQGTLAVLYGKPNCGKSFIALDMAFAIAGAVPWAGHGVSQGSVLYVAAEGGRGVNQRIRAIVQKRQIACETPFALAPCTIDLFDGVADVKAVVAAANALSAQHTVPLRLIVIDTLARSFGAGDENTVKDMTKCIRNLDAIREATQATILVIHHSGKDASKGARGSSALLGAADTEIEIADRRFKTTKQRDMPLLPADIRFDLQAVDLGFNRAGQHLSSCVVQFLTGTEFDPIPLAPAAEKLRQSLVAALATSAESEVSWAAWMEAHCTAVDPTWQLGSELPRGCSPSNLRKLRNEVIECGHVASLSDDRFALAYSET